MKKRRNKIIAGLASLLLVFGLCLGLMIKRGVANPNGADYTTYHNNPNNQGLNCYGSPTNCLPVIIVDPPKK